MMSEVVERAFAQFPCLVLSGARQAGKTSLVRHLFPQADYVTLDIPRDAETARLDPSGFLASRREPLIVDEVQYVPELPRHLKIAIDRDRRPGCFILTGSQDFSLMQGVSESLAGRCAVLSLPTLALAEAFPAATLQDADAFCWRGGFPDLWQRPELDRDLWLGSYFATYLERDVRNTLKVGSLRDFDRFLRAGALQVGQLLSLVELARDVGIAPNTAKSWLSILQASRPSGLPTMKPSGTRLPPWPSIHGKINGQPAVTMANSGFGIFLERRSGQSNSRMPRVSAPSPSPTSLSAQMAP
jgi:uncharacterized protein